MTVEPSPVETLVDRVAGRFGSVWPVHSFVTANPLAGYEALPFREAVCRGRRIYGGRGYPEPSVFRRAWEAGRIDEEVLTRKLKRAGYTGSPEEMLERMEDAGQRRDTGRWTREDRRVDAIVSKWLAAFVDQGNAHWSMPHRSEGFYRAFRHLARHDDSIANRSQISEWPDQKRAALRDALAGYSDSKREAVVERQLASLPGWTGYIKQRTEADGDWQQTRPITLVGYLAVRLQLAELVGARLDPGPTEPPRFGNVSLSHIWLEAMEHGYRARLIEALESYRGDTSDGDEPAKAQLVFCIDTRSEIIRRHIEAQGPYQTHGYAGFFGVPMEYEAAGSDVSVDACPPIVDAEHRIVERPATTQRGLRERHRIWDARYRGTKGVIESLQSNPSTAFSFVETAGLGYSLALAARTLMPETLQRCMSWMRERIPRSEDVCELVVDRQEDDGQTAGLTLEEQVDVAEDAFELMGWEEFSRLVVFVGHAADTANNPYDSSLDCGACAANPGGPSARALAAICQKGAVREALKQRGIDIPDQTVFVAGEHNTTTDRVRLFDAHVPDSHQQDLEELRRDLGEAQAGAAAERAEMLGGRTSDGVAEVRRRSADWAEMRPEWGLAGNAGFVVGPRSWTSELNLSGRCFLHSYDWRTDPDGEALEGILTGPMVVTQWINNQYYFATVDNGVYGGGSKITQNPVGNVGVYQGNGGDLMMGLPLQSLFAEDGECFHQPMRLSTVIEAPVTRVADILSDHAELVTLLDNEWLFLTVVDPTRDREIFTYSNGLNWQRQSAETESAEPVAETVTYQS